MRRHLAAIAAARSALRFAAIATLGCASGGRSSAGASDADAHQLAPDVAVARVADRLWVHTSWSRIAGGALFPSNGMLLETDSGSVLIDTAWDDRQTELLLDWADRELGRPVRRAVITHAHGDRLGGMGALLQRGVDALALQRTTELARASGATVPDSVRGLGAAPARDAAGFELYFPGHGHSPDNIVVYFARQRLLFGGCLIKPDTATTTGNVADADVEEWPRAVARVRERYADVRAVVPGHGAVGGPSALIATERLIAAKGRAAVEALRRR